MLNSTQTFVFYNDKEKAKEEKHNLPDSEDIYEKSKIVGSNACFKYDVSIASYGKRFSKTDDEESIQNIANNFKHSIMPEYEMLIKSAFCDLYINHLIHLNTPKES